MFGCLEESDLASLRKAGAVGDISSRFFDTLGREVHHPLNNRVIGLNVEEIRNIPHVIE
ncbi:sugar-binding domain-containing protein [Virgibacillus kekensis]|uniref:Sugar-binding domain-containing protein n=1 Tax=Virgibacillus kekensis TaxID=202261 RepID=A0ABV9DGP0_9BACI